MVWGKVHSSYDEDIEYWKWVIQTFGLSGIKIPLNRTQKF